jgi:hypothetical protein
MRVLLGVADGITFYRKGSVIEVITFGESYKSAFWNMPVSKFAEQWKKVKKNADAQQYA